VKAFVVKKMRALRKVCICTSTTLQNELLKAKRVELDTSTIRKILLRAGYRWLPRSQKPKYSAADKKARVGFAQEVLDMTPSELKKHLAMCMDGVVLSVPPTDPVARENHCLVGYTHCWRKRNEASLVELGGGGPYAKQIPLARAVPMWGGIGIGGFGLVMFHEYKKVNQHEWAKAAADGKLLKALRTCRPDRQQGPWHILCDNESFLTAPASRKVHVQLRVRLWKIPPRSPDLNPVEKYWSRVRAWLRKKDLADLKAKRPPLNKFALKQRVRALLRSPEATAIAKRIVLGLRKVSIEVKNKSGAATQG
jgi:hypothetical protein